MAPVVPAVVLALTVGTVMQRGLGADVVEVGSAVEAVPVPLADLAATGGLALLAVLATVGVGVLSLRGATALEELRAT